MIVDSIKALDNKKSLIISDTGFKFPLYKGEVRRLGIEINMEIDSILLEQIEDILKKRCKERSFYILERNDKTEKELRLKLEKSYYPTEIVDITIEFLKKYDYINDYRYASDYIRIKKDSKSRRQLEYDMMAKGISKSIFSEVIEKYQIDSRDIIIKILNKRKYDFEEPTKEQYNKQVQYLLRKGFLYEDIISVMGERQF